MNKKILMLFLIGAVVMSVPTVEAKKKNIFQKIGEGVKKGGKKAKELAKKAKKKARAAADKAKRKTKEAADAARRKIEETANRARAAATNAYNRVVNQARDLVSKADRLDNEIAQYFQKQGKPGSKSSIPAKKTPEARIKKLKRKLRF